MDQNVLGTGDDSFDPTIFNFIDVGNSAVSPNDQDNCFKWVDDFITSTELHEPSESTNNGAPASNTQAAQPSVNVQQITQQQLLQNAVLQQQSQQQQTPSLGNVIMAMGQQPSQQQQQTLAVAGSASGTQAQLLQNQATILQGNLGGQHLASPFILKTSSGTPIQLAQTAVTQSTTTISATPQQFLASATAIISRSITPSQSSSPLLSRSLTPSQTLPVAAAAASRPSSVGQPQVGVSVPASSSLNLLQLQQSQQINQQVPLSNFVTNQSGLQGHAVLTAQGSNIVHTQNALIQNPNVVNVNVAHVLPNQLPQLQGAILQTPQGKFLIQSPANNQPLGQQLNLSTLSNLSQIAGTQPVHQAVQMAPSMGLAQPTVIAQPPGNVALASNSGVTQQQPSFNLINLGGSQGQILVQRMPTSNASVATTPAPPLAQGSFLLRTINGQQQLVQQQPSLQPTTAGLTTTQLPQQLMAQAGGTQNIPLQQLLAGGGAQPLRLVGQPATATAQQQTTTTAAASNVVLQPLVAGNQVRLVGQQKPTQKKGLLPKGADHRRLTMTSTKPPTVTVNLGGQNLSLQQFQGLQLTAAQQQQVLLQQQQQQVAVSATTVQQTVVQASQQVTTDGSSKKSKSRSASASSVSSISSAASNTNSSTSGANVAVSNSDSSVNADNILSVALMSSGILDDESVLKQLNGSDISDGTMTQTVQTPTPTPPPPPVTSKSKKKKKKKEPSVDSVQPVVLSSTAARSSVTITTASATVVTTTISQSAVAGQAIAANSAVFSPATHVSMATQSVVSTTSQPTIGMPAIALAPASMPAPATTTTSVINTSVMASQGVTPVRGKHGSANMIRHISALQSMSEQDKESLQQIQSSLSKLKDKTIRTEEDVKTMQQLDMSRKRILAQVHTRTMAVLKQQQQQQQQQQQLLQQPSQVPAPHGQVTIQGQQVTIQPQPAQATPQQVEQSGLVGQPLLTQSNVQPQLKVDVKPLLGTPSTPVVQIQPKANAKLKLVTPKPEPGLVSSQPVVTQDTKPVLMAGGVQTSPSNLLTQISQGTTYKTTTGNVIMTMSNPPNTGQTGSAQPQMLRIQIGGSQKSPAVSVPTVAVTAHAPTTTQQLVVQPSQKIVMATNVTTTMSTAMTPTPAVSQTAPLSVGGPRPVQIKIANQVRTLQLTPQQQEKLELHLSRMTLEQQQAFLQQQHHILAKLQHRADSQVPAPPAALQATHSAAGSKAQGAAAIAPAVVAAVSAIGDTSADSAQTKAKPTTNATTSIKQQLPVTVQALESGSSQSDTTPASKAVTPAAPAMSRARLEIPKSSIIHSQLGKDQEHAVSPDITTPFKDHREACRRLLRFHVYQDHGATEEKFDKFDTEFETHAKELVEKKDTMLAQYRRLMMEDSMRKYPTSEQVLISRMWCNEMTLRIRQEKQEAENDPDTFEPMPTNYLEKDLTKAEEEESEEEYGVSDDADGYDEDENSEREEELNDELHKDSDGDRTDTYPPDESVEIKIEEKPYLEDHRDSCYPSQEKDLSARCENEEEAQPHPEVQDSFDYSGTSLNDSYETPSPPREVFEDLQARKALTPRESPNHRESPSPAQDEQLGIVQESSHSSPPRPRSPRRTMVKLVIRNDGKSFTSKFVRRRGSEQPECRTLRSRSQSGDKKVEARKCGKKEAKKAPVTEEIEYIDVDNSRYNRGVSVTLERLPERTSQDYGLDVTNKASTSSSSCDKKPACGNENLWTKSSGINVSSKSGNSERKRRREETELQSNENRHIKRERHISGASGDSCDEKGDSSFREFEESKRNYKNSPVREFYVGSAMESLEHFDSDDDGRQYVEELDTSSVGVADAGLSSMPGGAESNDNSSPARNRPVCSSPTLPVNNLPVHSHLVSKTHTTDSLQVGSGSQYVVDSEEEEGPQKCNFRPAHSLPGEEGHIDFDEYIPESPGDDQGMHPPPFPEQISPGLIQTDRMFDTSPAQEMESSFDLDNPDPQRNMVNPQVQSAIDSILNNSGSSENDGQQGRRRTRSSMSQNYLVDDASIEYDVGIGRSGRSGRYSDTHQPSAEPVRDWDEDSHSQHDLDAAVQSILR